MDCDTIDLNRAEKAVSSLPNDERYEYQPRKSQTHNHARYAYLPFYPTTSFGPNDHLLLANVPVTRLALNQIIRRQYGAYTTDALMLVNNYQYSNDGFTLSPQNAEELAARL